MFGKAEGVYSPQCSLGATLVAGNPILIVRDYKPMVLSGKSLGKACWMLSLRRFQEQKLSGPAVQWWANIIKWTRTYIWIPHYVLNYYLNIFKCNIITERISKHICTPEIAQIQLPIIFEGHCFKYSNICTYHWLKFFLKGSLMLSLNKILHWIFVDA